MDSDPYIVNNATDKPKDNQRKDLKMKQKVEDLGNQPKDLKMKQKVEDLSPYPEKANLKELNRATVDGFKVPLFKGRSSVVREDQDCTVGAESSKRKRITKSSEPIDHIFKVPSVSPPAMEPLKIVEEIVRIYSDYIEHILVMAKDRLQDEERWNFDQILCSGLAESFAQKIERLGCELERMKEDLSQTRNYSFIEPRVRQIMSQLVKMQERFDGSPNISASSKKNCTKQELVLCIDEIGQLTKELYAITWTVGEIKTMKMHKNTLEIKHKNLRFI